ncbi:MAG: tryptophan 2,3-dioxygenase family protein [Planctomycetota bacterium]|nr:tryptophan 2,3-dioxygenase family protein [Planctomycetota bacterium]
MSVKATNYWDYIKVEEILSLQGGLENDEKSLSNEEHLFIVVHQVFELWFRMIIRELVTVRNLLEQNPVPEQEISLAVHSIERVEEILKLASDHFRIIETMTTRDYLEFRDKLSPASGFQSAQMREIEIILGLEDSERLPFGGPNGWKNALKFKDGSNSKAYARVMERLNDMPTVREVVENWLERTPIHGSSHGDEGDEQVVQEFLDAYMMGHEKSVEKQLQLAKDRGDSEEEIAGLVKRFDSQLNQARDYMQGKDSRQRRIRAAAIFIASYRELPLLAWPRRLIDSVLSMEQAMIIFRQRHARMVERVIGRRVGTGGSAGVSYLDETAKKYRVFKDLWAVRTLLLEVNALPKVQKPEFYGFATKTD